MAYKVCPHLAVLLCQLFLEIYLCYYEHTHTILGYIGGHSQDLHRLSCANRWLHTGLYIR